MKKVLKVLLIKYVFITGQIGPIGDAGMAIKQFYEKNSQKQLTIELTKTEYSVPFGQNNAPKSVNYVKPLLPKNYDVYVHFARPQVSRTGGKHVVTHSSRVNAVHEFGHAIGLHHANSQLGGGKLARSKDPFSHMTSGIPYSCMSPVHLAQLKWFKPKEVITWPKPHQSYRITMLKNFEYNQPRAILTRSSSNNRRYYVTYGELKNERFLVVHTWYQDKNTFHSVLVGKYRITGKNTWTHTSSNITFNITTATNRHLTISLSGVK